MNSKAFDDVITYLEKISSSNDVIDMDQLNSIDRIINSQ